MNQSDVLIFQSLLENALRWFLPYFRRRLVNPVESHFPNYPLPREIQSALDTAAALLEEIDGWADDATVPAGVVGHLSERHSARLPLFKQILLLYRRHRAADTESKTEKTFHLELTRTLEKDLRALDALVGAPEVDAIGPYRLPRLMDYLPVQLSEAATTGEVVFAPRQHDEKFRILQAPSLILPDLAYFRAKCEEREAPLAIAFFDIDHFKQFNTRYTETKVDRNLLPRFMQTIEAHAFHHGQAYRQGGDEFFLVLPALSNSLALAFVDELRGKLAGLDYPEILEKTTVSVGLCHVGPDCPWAERELVDCASRAKQFAKEHGRNCIATYATQQFQAVELTVVRPEASPRG